MPLKKLKIKILKYHLTAVTAVLSHLEYRLMSFFWSNYENVRFYLTTSKSDKLYIIYMYVYVYTCIC